MNNNLWNMVDAVAMEKDLDEHVVVQALERAMAVVCRRNLDEGARVRCSLQEDGSFRAWRLWEVARDDARLDNPAAQVRRMDVPTMGGEVLPDDTLEQPLPPPPLTRVVARRLYQHLVQEVRQAQRMAQQDAWRDRVGEMASGVVRHVAGNQAFVDVEGAQVGLGPEDRIPGERLKTGARVRLIVTGLNPDGRGAALTGSRRSEALLEKLLETEVPEIRQGLVEIKAVARDGSGRAKVAVHALDRRVDAVGACVGMRGMRIQAVSGELFDERIDLVEWSEDPATFVVRALMPASVLSLVVDEDARIMDVAVPADNVGLALGRGGQNVRLASRLTGWKLRVWDEAGLATHMADERAQAVARLMAGLDVDEELAGVLVDEGFEDVATVAAVDPGELLGTGLDKDLIQELQERAVLAAARLETAPVHGAWDELDEAMKDHLRAVGVDGEQALAEACVEDLAGVPGLDGMTAGRLILKAREPWLEALGRQGA